MKKINYFSLLMILIFFFTSPGNLFSNYKGEGKDNGKKPVLQKTTSNPSQSLLNINNASMWVTDAGYHDWVVASGWNGAFPNGTSVGAIFSEGIVWGGQVYDGGTQFIRVTGNDYGSGTAAITRLYRVRPDYLTGSLAADAAGFNSVPVGQVTEGDIKALREQYATDWKEWPAYDGSPDGDQRAPYKDVDGDGKYDPDVDIPGIPGASQTIFIKYNDSQSASHFGSVPIGLEVSEVYWAYAYSGALGNVIYRKVDIVYKGTPTSAANSHIDSMYLVMWSDTDVGNSSDDFAGCDTSLNLSYAYSSKATDATYAGLGLAPPAVGFDFLSGVSKFTGNPDDSAIIDLQWKKGYKYVNKKPMSSSAYFAAGGTWGDPDQGSYNTGALAFYNLMRGVLPLPPYPSAEPFPDNVVDRTADGIYLLAGDPSLPFSATNKIDGTAEGPGDRRIMNTNGPITLSLGDTAQIVVATVYGLGTDNLSSITAMKSNDLTAQIVFDQLFNLPSIDPPNVQIANLDKKVVLNWGADASNLEKIETFADQNYTFEGYEVYQLPSPSAGIDDKKTVLLGTFDVVNDVKAIYDTTLDANGRGIPVLVANGQDKGIQRNLTITKDEIRKTELINGQEYYFVVVSYAQNQAPLLPFHVLRSPVNVLRVKPQLPNPGVRLTSSPGDTILTKHSAGSGDGFAVVTVIDPTKLTGHDYKVIFDDSADPVTWSLIDITANNKIVISGQVNQSGDNNYLTPDGLQVKVIGPPPGMKEWSITGTRRFSPVNGWPGLGLEGFSNAADPVAYDQETGTIGMAGHFAFGGIGTNLSNADYHSVVLKLAAVTDANSWDPLTAPTDPNISRAYRWLRAVGTTSTPVQPEFAPWIINLGSGYPYQDYNYGVPLSAWDMETNPPTRLTVGMFENNAADALLDGRYWPYDASAAFDNTVAREFVFIFKEPYSETANPAFEVNISNNSSLPLMWVMVCARRNSNPWAAGDEFEILANHPNTSADVFTFSTQAPTLDAALAKADVEKINVFPNPYYGYQYREIAPNNKYITFSHLPDDAIIRIFDLSGVLVRTINHNGAINGQFDTWNLTNDSNYPVASGIYVAYIDMPVLGTTKILKLAVILDQQMLKVY